MRDFFPLPRVRVQGYGLRSRMRVYRAVLRFHVRYSRATPEQREAMLRVMESNGVKVTKESHG